MRKALKERSPQAQDIPLPTETKRAADFISDSHPRSAAGFWGKQLEWLSPLKKIPRSRQKQWDSAIRPVIKPGAGKIQDRMILDLSAQCGIGGARWMDQFAFGFPITGAMSQKRRLRPRWAEEHGNRLGIVIPHGCNTFP